MDLTLRDLIVELMDRREFFGRAFEAQDDPQLASYFKGQHNAYCDMVDLIESDGVTKKGAKK